MDKRLSGQESSRLDTWRWAAFLLLVMCTLTAAAPAESMLTVPAGNCVWHAGDNSGWASVRLDESGWQPLVTWKAGEDHPYMWVRCHANLSPVQDSGQAAMQVRLYAAYELYVNGEQIGSAGNLRSGEFSMDVMRSYPLPAGMEGTSTIALRITRRIAALVPVGPLPPLLIRAGSPELLRGARSDLVLAGVRQHLIACICFSIVGIIGLILFSLWLKERERHELLLLAIAGVGMALIYLDFMGAAAMWDYPVALYAVWWTVPAILEHYLRTVFFFRLVRRPVPLFFWILIVSIGVLYSATIAVHLLAPTAGLRLDALRAGPIESVAAILAVLDSFAPLPAFLPWKNLSPRVKPLALLCLVWGAVMVVIFLLRISATHLLGVPVVKASWTNSVSNIEAVTTLAVMEVLLALLFREQQQTARERAILAGEMQAAQQVQHMLAPAVLHAAPGLHLERAFLPMRDVGGDFYLCRVLADGRQRIVLGDVSGKGAAAAMTASLLLGAAEGHDAESPTNVLAHMNRAMLAGGVGGFATCLCAEVSVDGHLILANAGHLAPYRNGKEIEVPGSLPLGIVAGAEYEATTLALASGDRLTFLSDGVIEAQSEAGELFGFERATAISHRSAQEIAGAAKAFGQQDDITVLTLIRLASGQESTTNLLIPGFAN
ncbi:MAG TPA: PP2C family protein-serine/threonine phosphatase [Terracidiphilus sp.]|nr:PP2C family protein-serine/threonine phosphatase [Terracidiphilus sp.]